MLLTTSPGTNLPRHSTGWSVLRLVSDRGGKHITEGPDRWGKRRLLTTPEKIAYIFHRAAVARARRP